MEIQEDCILDIPSELTVYELKIALRILGSSGIVVIRRPTHSVSTRPEDSFHEIELRIIASHDARIREALS
jgi:hypothetical protein